MKHISNLFDLQNLKSEPDKQTLDDEPISEDTGKVVNILFRELKAIFPAFRQAWPTDEDFNRAKSNWTKAFKASGINRIEQLKTGIEQCRLSISPFAPSVGQFIAWCKPTVESHGLLPKEVAYDYAYKIMRGEETGLTSDQLFLINHVIEQTTTYFLKNNSIDKTQMVFYRNYEVAFRDWSNGKLKTIHRGIEDKHVETEEWRKREKISRGYEEANTPEKAFAEIKRKLGINPDEPWPEKKNKPLGRK